MKKVKEILGNESMILFEVDTNDKNTFLKYAKENGCRWLNGDEIKPENDHCGYHMAITKYLELGSVPYFSWNSAKAIKFKSKGD